jgi:ribose transport system ATP-binding protein
VSTSDGTKNREPALLLSGITKVFPGVVALDKVDFAVYPNEIVGLVGENGAGKSTLMKIMIGLTAPDEGTITRGGRQVILRDPRDAIRQGIGMVFQDGTLVPNLSVMENLFLCHEKSFRRLGFLSRRSMRDSADHVLSDVDMRIDVQKAVSELSPAERQMVEIVRLLWLSRLYHADNPVLILDEPTTVLSDAERTTLFGILHSIRKQASVVLISHRLQEIVENADRTVILKDGRSVTDMPAAQARISEIEQLMVGHSFSADRFLENEQASPGEAEILRVEGLGRRGAFEPMSFTVRKGEIVSLVGLVGSGKEELCQCITGLVRADSGSMTLLGKKLPTGSPGASVSAGIGHIPIDRRNEGLALAMSVSENVNLLVMDRLKVLGFLDPRRERRNARTWVEECRIKTPSLGAMCANLSGGNQQKVVIAKWLSSRVSLIVLDHPTRGVDVGAKEEIYRLIRKLARDGIAMLIMSDTLEEDIGLCTRMLIMKDGRFVKEVACPPGAKPSPSDIIDAIV